MVKFERIRYMFRYVASFPPALLDNLCLPLLHPLHRENCRFLEEYENIVTGDGTVRYMLSTGTTPEDIYADNPSAKVVFALR